MSETLVCGSCGANVPEMHRFCGQCGGGMQGTAIQAAAPTAAFESVTTATARLLLIRGEGQDGTSFQLTGRHIAGRSGGAILFPEDGYLSPRHAQFFFEDDALYVEDDRSLNGVFIRLQDSSQLEDGDIFLVGEELLRVEWSDFDGQVIAEDGTHFFASPLPNPGWQITQLLEGGRPGRTLLAPEGGMTIGREHCDLDFPGDRFISGRHCQLEFSSDQVKLIDLSSRNGTFVRITGAHKLADGDFLFLGRQLLRVELPA